MRTGMRMCVAILCLLCISCSQQEPRDDSGPQSTQTTSEPQTVPQTSAGPQSPSQASAGPQSPPQASEELIPPGPQSTPPTTESTVPEAISGSTPQPTALVAPGTPAHKARTAEEEKKILASWEKKIGLYEYEIKIEIPLGSGSGKQILKVERTDADTWTVESEIEIEARVLGSSAYSYTEQSIEVWKGTDLYSFDDLVDDDGKKCDVKLVAEGDMLVGTVDRQPIRLPKPMSVGCSAWNISEFCSGSEAIELLSVGDSTVKIENFQVKDLGEEKIRLGEKVRQCRHLKFGESNWEMWLLPSGIPAKHVDIVRGSSTTFTLTAWTAME